MLFYIFSTNMNQVQHIDKKKIPVMEDQNLKTPSYKHNTMKFKKLVRNCWNIL